MYGHICCTVYHCRVRGCAGTAHIPVGYVLKNRMGTAERCAVHSEGINLAVNASTAISTKKTVFLKKIGIIIK